MDYKLLMEKVEKEEIYLDDNEDCRNDKNLEEGEAVWFYATTGFCGCDVEKIIIFDKKDVFLLNGEVNETYLNSLCDEFAYENGEDCRRGNEFDEDDGTEEEQEEMYFEGCLGNWSLEPKDYL